MIWFVVGVRQWLTIQLRYTCLYAAELQFTVSHAFPRYIFFFVSLPNMLKYVDYLILRQYRDP